MVGQGMGLGVTSNVKKTGDFGKKFSSFLNSKRGGNAMAGIAAGGQIGAAVITNSNTDHNAKWGGQDEATVGTRGAITNQFPIAGAIDGVMSMGGAAINTGNDYDEFGFNHREGYGERYMMGGALADPMSMQIRNFKTPEGAGARALLGPIFGTKALYDAEQKAGLERRAQAEREEESAWQLNQFNYTPQFDV